MKLRIKGNSVRLRLTQKDLAEFFEKGIIEERTEFGTETASIFSYAVVADKDAQGISASFENGRISVVIPQTVAEKWARSEETGISAEQNLAPEKTLGLLIEKDFACPTPRAGEDESDNFPHPQPSKFC